MQCAIVLANTYINNEDSIVTFIFVNTDMQASTKKRLLQLREKALNEYMPM